MMQCPQCQATLPDGAVSCQFCSASWAAPTRPGRMPLTQPDPATGSPAWVLPLYNLIAVWWIIDGLRNLVWTLVFRHELWGLFGLIDVVMGVGLLLRIEVVRCLVNLFCFVQILFGLLGIITGLLMSGFLGFIGVLMILMNALDIAAAGLMIYLIGETETRGPNF